MAGNKHAAQKRKGLPQIAVWGAWWLGGQSITDMTCKMEEEGVGYQWAECHFGQAGLGLPRGNLDGDA